jgi:hypothetical protein
VLALAGVVVVVAVDEESVSRVFEQAVEKITNAARGAAERS